MVVLEDHFSNKNVEHSVKKSTYKLNNQMSDISTILYQALSVEIDLWILDFSSDTSKKKRIKIINSRIYLIWTKRDLCVCD